VRLLVSILLAMAAAQAAVDALAESWPVIVACGLAGGLAFAAFGAMTLRLGR
jgi:hypothetical protein